MKENVGRIDRIARAIVAPGLVALGYTRLGGHRGDLPGIAVMIAGALVLETAITRVCPLNALFGLDTRTKRERARDLQEQLQASNIEMATIERERGRGARSSART